MNIQKVSQQPGFGARMALKGNPKAIAAFVEDLAKEIPSTKFITKDKGKLAYVAHLGDEAKFEGKSGEVAADIFDSIAGRNPYYTEVKDLEKAKKAKSFDPQSLQINK